MSASVAKLGYSLPMQRSSKCKPAISFPPSRLGFCF
jgi:hypothetical protein